MLEAKSLRKAVVPPSLLRDPSPGNIQSTRLALHVNDGGSSCSVYIASGCRVYKIEISMEDSVISKGKESLLIPVNAEVIHSSVVDRCPHRSEIQSVVLTEGGDNCLIMGTVDSYGHLIVSRLDVIGSDIDRLSYSVLPRDCGIGEGSWAGICFSPAHWSTVAVARSFCRSIDVYDQDIHIRSLHTLWYPASLSFFNNPYYEGCSSVLAVAEGSHVRLWYPASLSFFNNPYYEGCSSVLAVAEGSQLSIWDLRTNQNGGCVQRICGSIGDLIYSLCSSPSGAIAIGGSDRTVTIYDPRRWSAMSRWVNCSKYEITGLSFSTIDSDYIYVQGVDSEVICGAWKGGRKAFSFRGDSNWLGFSKCANADVLAGWCDSGSIFVADIVEEQS